MNHTLIQIINYKNLKKNHKIYIFNDEEYILLSFP